MPHVAYDAIFRTSTSICLQLPASIAFFLCGGFPLYASSAALQHQMKTYCRTFCPLE